jgi:acyl-coenzyme A synthetase/AMP-(fatty) acid ligase
MISSFQGIITEEWKIMGTVIHHVTGTCLTYANDSAVKREDTAWQEGRDVWWQDVVPKYPKESAVEWVDAEDTLFLLYTSGSTGKPKGVLHTTGGYMVYTATTFKYAFDYHDDDIYWYTSSTSPNVVSGFFNFLILKFKLLFKIFS